MDGICPLPPKKAGTAKITSSDYSNFTTAADGSPSRACNISKGFGWLVYARRMSCRIMAVITPLWPMAVSYGRGGAL